MEEPIVKIIPELFENPNKEFEAHIDDASNTRIVLSGKFGIGKTTFVDHFFSEERQQSRYNRERFQVVKLRPINYSVASNEDIFRYIKFDIIYELLLTLKFEPKEEHFSYLQSAPFFVLNNLPKNALPLLSFISKVGKYAGIQGAEELDQAVSPFSSVSKLVAKYLEFHKNVSRDLDDEEKLIKEYSEKFIGEEGNLYEFDIYTQFINQAVEELKSDNTETVLIIDDLDRIDPHHIFRIFNVFAAHLDDDIKVKNKFGFDRVIFVCDIQNIRNIFHHFYGTNTDFTGYIDKFYSKSVFFFDNFENIKSMVERIIKSTQIIVDGNDETDYNRNLTFYGDITYLLSVVASNQQISLRQLLKFSEEGKIFIRSRKFEIPGSGHVNSWAITSVVLIQVLNQFFGSADSLISALENAKNRDEPAYDHFHYFVGGVVVLLDYKNHQFKTFVNELTFNRDIDDKLTYTVEKERQYYYGKYIPKPGVDDKQISMIELCYEAAILLKSKGVIN